MGRYFYIISLFVVFISVNIFSQVRYRDEVFSAYTLVSDITYGTGSKNLLDLYTGTGDVATSRPLVIYIHGGAFKGGDKDPNSGAGGCGFLRYFGYGMAKRGYVVASINYRVNGWSDDPTHFKAMLQALQDTKAAIRFFRKNAAQYGIDTGHIYVVGQSAGAHTSANMAFLDSAKVEKYSQWSSVGWSAVGGSYENLALGNAGYSSSFHAAISCWGALVDTNYIQPGGMPIYCVHGTADATVPYIYGTMDSPFNYGSQLIYDRAQHVNIPSGLALYAGKGHSLDSDAASQTDAYAKCGAWLYTIYSNVSVPLTLYSPAGGELWQQGMVYPITWKANGVTNVNIDYSTDGGTNWISIASNLVASTGTYNWTIPNTLSSNCKVKVTNSADATVLAISPAVFTISAVLPPSITLNTPAGAETFMGGNFQSIKWTSINVTNIKIDFSTDNGTNWSPVASSVAASLGTYLWTVPNIDATQCLIRLSDASNPSLFSVNPDMFSIKKVNISILPMWEENFDYLAGDSLNAKYGGWTAHAQVGTLPPKVIAQGLSYPGYPSSGIGNAVQLLSVGEDINRKVPTAADSITSGSAYVSFLVRVDTAKTGDIFLHLGQYSFTSTSAQRARVYVKAASTGSSNIAFGVFKGSSTTVVNPVYTDTIYKKGTTYLVVLKYNFVPGTTPNDFCNLWVNPAIAPTEPAPALTDSSYTVSDLFSVGTVCLRQGTTTSSPSVIIDGIRLAKSWNAAIGQVTAVNDPANKVVEFRMNQNYPNPFNPTTKISYALPMAANVKITVFNTIGKEISTLLNSSQNQGYHELNFDASNLPSGMYFYRISVSGYHGESFNETKKMIFLK